jgi:four helix bundle protein
VRIVEQIIGAGTCVGANVFEADLAMSRADFCECLGASVKEASEYRFWIRRVGRQGWVAATRLSAPESESIEIQKNLNRMIVRSRTKRGP